MNEQDEHVLNEFLKRLTRRVEAIEARQRATAVHDPGCKHEIVGEVKTSSQRGMFTLGVDMTHMPTRLRSSVGWQDPEAEQRGANLYALARKRLVAMLDEENGDWGGHCNCWLSRSDV